ncbi:hypothetical protein C9J21_17825 [Photobacterium phosphoreum]|uniref:hypothetical protein n=1 Tax=Photobacterium phosphoreum TaxID=659 RepID=UPI000D16D793|nr:hypothetical protein [Photobacterium phosphoreum]PSW31208.1 hypothetical protein C9J21_17825 [Photobacterium phosphoreum]
MNGQIDTLNVVTEVSGDFLIITLPKVNDDFVFNRITSEFFCPISIKGDLATADEINGLISDLAKVASINVNVRDFVFAGGYGYKSVHNGVMNGFITIPDYSKCSDDDSVREIYKSLDKLKAYIAIESTYKAALPDDVKYYCYRNLWACASLEDELVGELRSQLGSKFNVAIYHNKKQLFSNIPLLA